MSHTVVQMFEETARKYPDLEAQWAKDAKGNFIPTTYRGLVAQVHAMGAALVSLGVKPAEPVGLISDNRQQWLVADLAILAVGACDVPRGRDAMPYELSHILGVTDTRVCFCENEEQLSKVLSLRGQLPKLEHLVIMDDATAYDLPSLGARHGLEIHLFCDLLTGGSALLRDPKRSQELTDLIARGKGDDTATIIFTSGTTGDPKGVMLSHTNFLYQLEHLRSLIDFQPAQRWLSILPVWHSFERILQYAVLSFASTIAYSKPIGKILLTDLQRVSPHFMGSVPRIWETVRAGVFQSIKGKSKIQQRLFAFFLKCATAKERASAAFFGRKATFKKAHRVWDVLANAIPLAVLSPLCALGNKLVFSKIKAKLGKNFIAGVSGGGSMPKGVDQFFKAIGVTLLDGYGLTETAPVLAVRSFRKPVSGTVRPLGSTQIRIVDEQGNELPPGKKGVIQAKGPQVMQGYYKRPDLTAKILSPDGWLDTGDLGMWTHDGDFSICGRAKDTIVLSGGENLEPVPIEAKLCESEFIEQAVVVGQDKKYLGALVVLAVKGVERYLKEHNIPYLNRAHLEEMDEVKALVNREIQEAVSTRHGFKTFEQVNKFVILERPFEVGNELSAKQEVKRHRINELYGDKIQSMYAS